MQILLQLFLPIVAWYSVTLDGVLDWILNLLTTYTQDSELQAITAPPSISTIHKSPQHPLSLSSLSLQLYAIHQRFYYEQILCTLDMVELCFLKRFKYGECHIRNTQEDAGREVNNFSAKSKDFTEEN
jgi:hypothetical protein